MKNITKTFTEIYTLDMEGRYGDWTTTNKTYEEAVKAFDNYVTGARIVEKTFNPDTFEITTKVIREAKYVYDWERGERITHEVI